MKYDAEYGDRCLREIADLAKERNREIMAKKENFDGGCLILGNSYARNRFLFCGLNPGDRGEGKQGFEPGPCTEVPYNYPFKVDPIDRGKGNSYFRNCHNFCEQNEGVGRWFYENFTSTFLSPWRSKDNNALRARNLQTDGLLFKYSGEILSKMIEHHDAKLMVIAGVSSIHFLRCFLNAFDDNSEVPEPPCIEGPGGTYQWSRTCLRIQDKIIPVLQIPHFSRANSQVILKDCACWLRRQIPEFGLAVESNH